MTQPEGFKARGQENKVIHLQRALYGLKKAGLAWWKELNFSMNKLDFKCLVSDAGCKDYKEIIIAIVYVDDAMFFGKNKAQVDFKKVSTKNYSLVFKHAPGKGLAAYLDSDWASDPITQRSVTGYFFQLAGGPITWRSRAQTTVAYSLTEAEYMALSDCFHQVSWIRDIFLELGIRLAPIPVYADNQGSIFIGSNPVQEICTKHIDVKYHYVHECIAVKKSSLKITLLISLPRILDTSSLRSSNNSSALSSSHKALS
jgi:hypothetical protein